MSENDKQLKFVEEDIVDEDGNELVEVESPKPIQSEQMSLTKMMELSEMLAKSTIVPQQYMNRSENCFIALDLANRLGISPMTVMQNLYLIQGKPSLSGSFISALINSTPLFSNVELVWVGEKGKDNRGAYVKAYNNKQETEVVGTTVTMGMAKREGWTKNPKWQNMPELMISYRAYSFFGRVHASELLSGIYDDEEMNDVRYSKRRDVKNPYE